VLGGEDVQLLSFLTYALDGEEWWYSHSRHFTPEEKILCFPLYRVSGPPNRSVLRTYENRKSVVQYGSGAVSTKDYGNSEVVFDISRNGKLTLYVAGNVAAYKVSHPTATDRF
jgi:hypothetical protein